MSTVNSCSTHPNIEQLTDLPHSKHYRAQAREHAQQHQFGYDVIKLNQTMTWVIETNEKTTELTARPGEYLVKCQGQPFRKIESWTKLKKEFHVFRNHKSEK